MVGCAMSRLLPLLFGAAQFWNTYQSKGSLTKQNRVCKDLDSLLTDRGCQKVNSRDFSVKYTGPTQRAPLNQGMGGI